MRHCAANGLNFVRNIALGVHQEIPWQKNYSLVRPATSSGRQFSRNLVSDVYTDDGEVAVSEFPYVRTTGTAGALRLRAKPAEKHHICFHRAFTNIEHIRCQQSFDSAFRYGVTERQILKRIGDNVKAARLKADLTQECLAELIGVHWQTISYIENGRNPFSVLIFARLAPALETSPNRLLEGLPVPNASRMERVKQALVRKRARKVF